MRIGVLALQGGFDDHRAPLEALGHEVAFVKTPEQLASCDGVVLPGGESTTQLKLLASSGLREPLSEFVAAGRPTLATCAGLILVAKSVSHPAQDSLGLVDVSVARNAWGRQVHSFEAVADVPPGSPFEGLEIVFIRAPRIVAFGDGVEVLASTQDEPVLVRRDAFVGATFHPELTDDLRVHRTAFG